ncbi:phosphatase PAP2 family protein [Streptomyces sp. NPDC006172]|uniref:phosphatase PAP2 family protein n=1 Tax=Streptomyces sp. NPDC006172 TaxID=3154470 RepID=UPI0033EDF10A
MSGRSAPATMPLSLRAWFGLTALCAALVVLGLGSVYAGDSEPAAVDTRIGAAVDEAGPPWRDIALAVDFLGEPLGAATLVGVAVIGCLSLRRPRAAVSVVAGAGAAVGVATLLKHLVGRTIHGEANLSYPSGHTAFLTALALVVALAATGRLGLGGAAGLSLVLASALVAGFGMGWAQVVLGAHYPTDAFGGWCTALAVTPTTTWLVDCVVDRIPESRRPTPR